MKTMRKALIKRETKETKICIVLNIDGNGRYNISTGIKFFDHMLTHIAKHGSFDLEIKAKGDNIPDKHHIVEDVGIVLGEAFKKALSYKKGINRYGTASVPMDESLVNVSLDISGRPFLSFTDVVSAKKKTGDFDNVLAEEFFRAFVNNSGTTLHIRPVIYKNPHHLLEAMFKSFGVALKEAVKITGKGIPSTKGKL